MLKKDFIKLQKEREQRILQENRDFYDCLMREYFHGGKKRAAKKSSVPRCYVAD